MPNTVSHHLHFWFHLLKKSPHTPIPRQPGISEWYQPAEPGTGLHPRPSSATALKAYFPEIDDSWSSVWYPTRKGESLAALHDRVAGCLTVLVPEVQRRFAGAHKRILLVSHAATVIALARELVGDRDLSFRAACCSLTVLDRNKDAAAATAQGAVIGGWSAILLGGGEHLKDGLQRAWGFPDVPIADGKVSGRPSRQRTSWSVALDLLSSVRLFCRLYTTAASQGRKTKKMSPWAHRSLSYLLECSH
jgi:hypothetical protein